MNYVVDWMGQCCEQHLLNEKWLIADDLCIANQWKDRLVRNGRHAINLHSKTVRLLTLELIGNHLDQRRISFANNATSRLIVHRIASEQIQSRRAVYFDNAYSLESICDLIAGSIRDLRLAGISPDAFATIQLESDAKARDLHAIYQAYCDQLTSSRFADYADCLRLATQSIQNKQLVLADTLLVLVPESLTLYPAEEELLNAIRTNVKLEQPFIEQISDESASVHVANRITTGQLKVQYFSAIGEVNEVRGVLQRCLSSDMDNAIALDDVELLHTDDRQYVPLVLEVLAGYMAGNEEGRDTLVSIDKLPVTFADGVPCIYSRPGRALRSWIRWIKTDYLQTKAVQLIREGLLYKPVQAESIGYSRLANALREIPIAFQSARYLIRIREAIETAKQQRADYKTVRRDTDSLKDDIANRDFGLPTLEALLAMTKPLIELAPSPDDDSLAALTKARKFVWNCTRADNKLDRVARDQLVEEINGLMLTLRSTSQSHFDVMQWLEELPTECTVLASGPMPGCIHVASLNKGGYSGRKNLFVVGLDDDRFPKRIPVDPILLDSERERISCNLPTAEQRTNKHQQDLKRMLYRATDASDIGRSVQELQRVEFVRVPEVMGTLTSSTTVHSSTGGSVSAARYSVTVSYSTRSFLDDRECFPSPALLDLYRISSGNSNADLDDLIHALAAPSSFISDSAHRHLAASEISLSKLLKETDASIRQQMLEDEFEHVRAQRIALEASASAQLSSYDGHVPIAGRDLDPTLSDAVSATHLEDYGTCPRKFFFKRGLKVYPPSELQIDRERWLDPLRFGNLVHELFEEFLRDLTSKQRMPELKRDRNLLVELMHSKIDRLEREVPIPNQDAFLRQRKQLEELCEIFLVEEERYCRDHNAQPWVLESSIGLGESHRNPLDHTEPIAITLSDGRMIRVAGRVDRIDKLFLDGSERYVIWDYKSGSDFGFAQDDPFAQGRKLQPFIYIGMLRHRIAAIGGNPDAVDSFGYFFPSPKTNGLRLRWSRGDLRAGDAIMRDICELIASGVFVPTTDSKDCTYCDYQSICGDAFVVAKNSKEKVKHPSNHILEPIRRLREIDVDTEVQHDGS